jgi:hypothetical protein
MHSSRGRLRTGASEDWWMVAPGCDEWLTTWCGLTLGRVLQVQVMAWFALVQVKSVRERLFGYLSVLVYALRGLWGVERQVGLTWGTRWPAGSSAGRMVARKARQSGRPEPVHGSGSRPESARGVCGGSPKNRQLLGWATKLRLEARQAETGSGRAEKLRCRWTRGWVAGLASGGRVQRWRHGRAMKRSATWPICP